MPRRYGIPLQHRLTTSYRKDPVTRCWLWTGSVSKDGYPRIGIQLVDGTWVARNAHTIMHTQFVGPIPPGYNVYQTCRVRRCVNPSHLKAVPHAERIQLALAQPIGP